MTMLHSQSRRSARRAAGRVLVTLALAGASAGCAAAAVAPTTSERCARGGAPAPSSLAGDGWQRFAVERHGFAKDVTFTEVATAHRWKVRYKGTPVSWISPINIVVPEKIYSRRSHRARYRFAHPLTGEALVLRARATSQTVGPVPIPPDRRAPVVEIHGDEDDGLRGWLAYDVRSPILFAGELAGRAVAIEQLPATPGQGVHRPTGPVDYVLAPFPRAGEFALRIDGVDVARFAKCPQRGTTTAYELALRDGGVAGERDDAALAFVVFVLMEGFVSSSVG